jgi:hypothetical protein
MADFDVANYVNQIQSFKAADQARENLFSVRRPVARCCSLPADEATGTHWKVFGAARGTCPFAKRLSE